MSDRSEYSRRPLPEIHICFQFLSVVDAPPKTCQSRSIHLQAHKTGARTSLDLQGYGQWCFREIQRQLEYKAAWEGVRVVYVEASNTSKTCSECGYINRALAYERAWSRPNCGARLDRDVNAARNLRSRYLEAAEVRPSDEWPPCEAMVLRDAIS